MTQTSVHINRRLDKLLDELDEIKALVIQLQSGIATSADILFTDSTAPGEEQRPRTGYRFVRGSHSGTFIRDPQGTDRLPNGYGYVPEST